MYSRMIDQYYVRELPLPLDVAAVCRLVRAGSAPARRAVQTVLAEFFTQQADGWHQKRCDVEIASYRAKSATASASAAARWAGKRTQSDSDANAYANALQTQSVGNANQNQNQNQEKRKPRAHARELPPDFGISDRVKAWALAKGYAASLQSRFEHFVSACRAKGYRYVDWDEALMTAIRKDWAGLGGPQGPKKVAL